MQSCEAVRDWEAKLTPLLIDSLRRRRGTGSRVRRWWYVDETYVKVDGRWCCLYRAIDRTGASADVMLSETRGMAAAEQFFQSAKAVTGVAPARITMDRPSGDVMINSGTSFTPLPTSTKPY